MKQLSGAGDMFEFPEAEYNASHWHCARVVAVDDTEVPAEYWRFDTMKAEVIRDARQILTGKLIKLAAMDEGMGPPDAPRRQPSYRLQRRTRAHIALSHTIAILSSRWQARHQY